MDSLTILRIFSSKESKTLYIFASLWNSTLAMQSNEKRIKFVVNSFLDLEFPLAQLKHFIEPPWPKQSSLEQWREEP